MIEELFELHNEIIKSFDTAFKRYLYSRIDWDNRLIGIIGSRGVGKTTLLLQYYQDHFESPKDCLYISADNIVVSVNGLFNIAREFFKLDGKVLIIDEIHKYKNWSQELKNIYDSFPKARILISGSSSLDIIKGKGDLSRRIILYHLWGLSFREYLTLQTKQNHNTYSLDTLLKKHIQLSGTITKETRVLKHFKDYLTHGYYPFYLEGIKHYQEKLNNVIEKVIYEDIPSTTEIKTSSIPFLKKLIYLIATSQPFVPNIEKISSQLKLSKEYVYHYLEYLERAKIFSFLYPKTQGFKLIRKPEKIYLENPNLIYNVVGKSGFRSEIGAVRECFFLNQIRSQHHVHWSPDGDFLVEDHYIFEIGGKKKNKKQVYHLDNSYVVIDGIEVGTQNKIPLWLFGFLY